MIWFEWKYPQVYPWTEVGSENAFCTYTEYIYILLNWSWEIHRGRVKSHLLVRKEHALGLSCGNVEWKEGGNI